MLGHLFADPSVIALGAATGLVFGFLLERGGVARFDTIVGQLLLRDHTMLRVMLTAILVGSLGIHGMLALGWIDGLSLKATHVLGNALGGATLGAGMAILGFCPGTAVVAAGAGSSAARYGIAGMFFGAGVYAELHPWMARHVLDVGALGKVTLHDQLGGGAWWYVGGLVLIGVAIMLALPRGRRDAPAPA